MNCPDCKDIKMNLDAFATNKDKDFFEAVWKCPSCSEVFFASIYRDLFNKIHKEKGKEKT